MINKTASDPSKLLESIQNYTKEKMFRQTSIRPSDMIAISFVNTKIIYALDGIKSILKNLDNRDAIEINKVAYLLGLNTTTDEMEFCNSIYSFLKESSKEEFLNFLKKIIEIYTSRSSQIKQIFDGFGSNQIVSQIEDELGKLSGSEGKEEKVEEVTFSEPNLDLSGIETSWLVSSGDRFAKKTPYYGPFDNNIEAVLFCILTHPPGFSEESSVMSEKNLMRIMRNSRWEPSDSIEISPVEAKVKNEVIAGKINQAALGYTDGKKELKISTSGKEFDKFVEFFIKQKNTSKNEIISISDAVKWLDKNIASFPHYYFGKLDVQKEKNIQNIKNPAGKSFDPSFNTIKDPLKEISSITKQVEKTTDFSVVSKEDNTKLSDSTIKDFINQLKIESASFKSLKKNTITLSYSSSFEELQRFFDKIFEKDFEIKKQIKEFREANKLNINTSMNYEWEYREFFSVLAKIISDEELKDSFSSLLSEFSTAYFFVSGKSESVNKKINYLVKRFAESRSSELSADIDSAIAEVRAASIQGIRRIVSLEFERSIGNILDTPSLLRINTSNFLEKIISNLSIKNIIDSNIDAYFSSKEKIISSQKFYMVNCGVCGQKTQIPERYRDIIDSFSKEIKQYSFFRNDGSVITESELTGIDSIRTYALSSEASKLIRDYQELSRKTPSGKTPQEDFSSRQYTWEEVNNMISQPNANTSALQVEGNIIGLIVRNDILKNHFDAKVSGERGIFANRSMCAGSLIDLRDDLRTAQSNQKYLTDNEGFKCKASISSSFISEVEVPKYLESAFIVPNGNMANKSDSKSFFSPGFRFSKNYASCPCIIESDSETIRISLERKHNRGVFSLIAIPNVPENIAEELSNKLQGEGEPVSKENLFYPPTMPNGELATNLPRTGYVICGKKVSLSLLDKDPSSKNYIRTILGQILSKDGNDALVSVVSTLIDSGVDMNDLKPHVEAVVQSSFPIKSADKKAFLKKIFFESKISLGMARSSISDASSNILKNIGLVCEHGHKFTIEQSWNFARTHSALIQQGRINTPNYKGMIQKTVHMKDLIEFIKADPEQAMQMMLTSPSDNKTGFGVFKTNIDEKQLRNSGYKQPIEVSSYEELMGLIDKNLLYYKNTDGSVYIKADKTERGAIISKPWNYGEIKLIPQATYEISVYSGGQESLTRQGEDGGFEQKDLAAPVYGESDDDETEDDKTNPLESDLIFANCLIPDMEKAASEFSDMDFNTVFEKAKILGLQMESNSKEFVSKLINSLRLSRVWGTMAADANIDFLNRPDFTPEINPSLRTGITNQIISLFSDEAPQSEKDQSISNFFKLYDVFGLVERSVSVDKFLSLSSVTQYYKDFSAPFIANLKDKDAKQKILDALTLALSKNLPLIIKTEFQAPDLNENLKSISNEVAKYLMSPYDNITYDSILQNAIVNYSGRAFIFSFAIDMVEKIRYFYSKFFFNQDSVLYIGPYDSSNKDVTEVMDAFLSMKRHGDNSFPNILLIGEDEFNAGIEKIKMSLEKSYNQNTLFKGFMNSKKIKISIPSNKDDNINRIKLSKQMAVVFSRFAKSLSLASTSIDHVSSELSGKPMGSKSIKDAARMLDLVIEPLIEKRYPNDFGKIKERVTKSRQLYRENNSLFSRNAVGIARVNLSAENTSLDPIISKEIYYYTFLIKKDLLSGITETDRISPKLILLKKIYLQEKSTTDKKEMYLCLVPKGTELVREGVKRNIDLMDFLGPKIVKLDDPQGREFSNRYLSNVSGVDYSRVIIINSDAKQGSFLTDKELSKDPVMVDLNQKNNFDIKISKIDSVPNFWPPPRNLIFDEKNISDSQNSNSVNAYYKSLFGESHADFISNIEKFNITIDSSSQKTSSSHGMIIPFREEDENPKTQLVSNTVDVTAGKRIKDIISISDSKIFITLDSGKRLDISWAFKTLDPQIIEGGAVRHRLVQSGIVQKMNYISSKIDYIFNLFKKPSYRSFIEKIEEIKQYKISLDNKNSFLDSFFSNLCEAVIISNDIESGVFKAKLNFELIQNAIGKVSKDQILLGFPMEKDIFQNISQLVDYYNASQILNNIYNKQQPTLITADSINLKKGNKSKSLALSLLDPYSLWKIITNPVMSSRFGGPIKSENIELYKSFVIQIFGLKDIVDGVIEDTGFSPSDFKEEDLFDLSGFYTKYYKSKSFTEDNALKRFADLFKLDIKRDDQGNEAKSYINGHPINTNNSSADLQKIISKSQISGFLVDKNSYIEHPYRFMNSLDDITDSELKNIRKRLEKEINKIDLKELVFKERIEEIKNLEPGKNRADIIDNMVKEKFNTLLSEAMRNDPTIKAAFERNDALENGQQTLSIKELISLATGSGINRGISGFNISDYRTLSMEVNANLSRIIANLYSPQTKKAENSISWRKIAQHFSDDDGTMIMSLYRQWWDGYLNTMAKIAGLGA